MLSNGLVGLSAAWYARDRITLIFRWEQELSVIGLAAIIIGEVLMGRLIPFY